MFPLLMLASRLAPVLKSVSGSSLNLKNKSKDTTTKASAERDAETVVDKQGKEHAADSPTGRMIVNMTKEETEVAEMFGGMDLGKIKSALDEDSPIGMPDEVKGGVYKQIFEVNKMMLGSLQRIEGTMKLLLGLEYERALGFQQSERGESLTEGDTDDKVGEEGPGRFRRGLSAAGDMLGGAYSKAKGFASGSLAKLLGLGVLIFAFNKYREEIITAMAGILEYFSDVYDVFKADGIGAAFDKVLNDFKTKFFPKIVEVTMNILSFLFGAVKSAAIEFLYGAQGDKLLRQSALESGGVKENLSDASTGIGKSLEVMRDVNLDKNATIGEIEETAITLVGREENMKLQVALQKIFNDMRLLSEKTDNRIQWSGMPDLTGLGDLSYRTFSISKILAANPIIDGIQETSWAPLETIEMNKLGGITKTMTDFQVEDITTALADKSTLVRSGASKEEITAQDLVIKATGQKFEVVDETSFSAIDETKFSASGDTQSTKSLNGMKITGTDRSFGASANLTTVNNVDNSKVVDASQDYYSDLNAKNVNFTHMQLSRLNNGEAVFGF